jgi:ABC-type transport system involved in Fe-S cluster assembly fused permease/ATPase subunit
MSRLADQLVSETLETDGRRPVEASRESRLVVTGRLACCHYGHIAECGTHDELIARGGLYFHLYGQQLTA